MRPASSNLLLEAASIPDGLVASSDNKVKLTHELRRMLQLHKDHKMGLSLMLATRSNPWIADQSTPALVLQAHSPWRHASSSFSKGVLSVVRRHCDDAISLRCDDGKSALRGNVVRACRLPVKLEANNAKTGCLSLAHIFHLINNTSVQINLSS